MFSQPRTNQTFLAESFLLRRCGLLVYRQSLFYRAGHRHGCVGDLRAQGQVLLFAFLISSLF
jgi:hypothetical protein